MTQTGGVSDVDPRRPMLEINVDDDDGCRLSAEVFVKSAANHCHHHNTISGTSILQARQLPHGNIFNIVINLVWGICRLAWKITEI